MVACLLFVYENDTENYKYEDMKTHTIQIKERTIREIQANGSDLKKFFLKTTNDLETAVVLECHQKTEENLSHFVNQEWAEHMEK